MIICLENEIEGDRISISKPPKFYRNRTDSSLLIKLDDKPTTKNIFIGTGLSVGIDAASRLIEIWCLLKGERGEEGKKGEKPERDRGLGSFRGLMGTEDARL